jgi:hypothetical protein
MAQLYQSGRSGGKSYDGMWRDIFLNEEQLLVVAVARKWSPKQEIAC